MKCVGKKKRENRENMEAREKRKTENVLEFQLNAK